VSDTAPLLLADLVAATSDVAATRARKEKITRLADLLRTTADEEIAVVVGLVAGDPRQGRIGVGWATVRALPAASSHRSDRTVADLDGLLDQVASTRGEGSQGERVALLADFLSSTSAAEADFVRRLLIGELRQGANAGIVTDAVAKATEVPATVLRRAVMLSGDLGAAAEIAARDGRAGLEAVGLRLQRPIQPMLASTAKTVDEAVEKVGRSSVEWKLDGVRIQVHKEGESVRVWTRNLNEITAGVPEVVRVVGALDAHSLVLDGEVLGVDDAGDPLKFQDTMSNAAGSNDSTVAPFFFDLLHHDGEDLLDAALQERLLRLEAVVGDRRVPGIITDSGAEAQAVLDEALARGHEGVVVKGADSPYHAGRRGKTWRKVKPVHTLDLVVLAVEHGSGRRQGWLSNIHMGARDPETGGFVMVGKTFKGMTDEMLRWQTERFGQLAVDDNGWQVTLRPEQVVEIALDGVQRSTKYPGGVALRFARVVCYRDDKSPDEADTIDAVRALG
jgi:DNA ligase-1